MKTRRPPVTVRPVMPAECAGAIARTQDIARQTLEAVQAIERRLPAAGEPLYYIARIRQEGVKLASWPEGRRRPRWTVNPIEATGFRSYESAGGALKAMKRLERSGTRYELWRLVP